MDFDATYREAVDRVFRERLPGFPEASDFCLGEGKRLRPKLLLDAAAAWGGDPDAAVNAAVGVELLHHYLLVHDDLMDGDDLRRGKPTVHAAAIAKFGERMGRGIAIAIGDHLANEAFGMFAYASGKPDIDAELTRAAVDVTRETILGQMWEYVPDMTWTLEELERFYAYKTAAYSIRLPWLLADILAGSDPARRKAIQDASRELGIAYQFHDDLIEFRGDKPRDASGTAGDTARGKVTVVTRLLLDALPGDERRDLQDDWRRGIPLTARRLASVTEAANRYGIQEKVQEMIDRHAEAARGSLAVLRLETTPMVTALLDLLRH
jgi:geranylgeranyl diphosphate synthase type I